MIGSLAAMSDSTPGEPEDEAGPGSEQVRLFVSDGLIRVGRDATMRQMAQRMAAETHAGMVRHGFRPGPPRCLCGRRLKTPVEHGAGPPPRRPGAQRRPASRSSRCALRLAQGTPIPAS